MEKGQRMQAIAITAFGGPDRLTLMDLLVPACGPDQVLIKVQAASVGMWDVKVRQGSVRLEGQQFPLVSGLRGWRDSRKKSGGCARCWTACHDCRSWAGGAYASY